MMMKKIDYRDQFQSRQAAESYDANYAEEGYGNLLFQIEKKYLQEIIQNNQRNIEMLDFACGTGRIVSFLENLVKKSVGLDISPSMLERAKNNTNCTELVCGDLTRDSSLCPGPFDLIVTFRFVTNAEPDLRQAALQNLRERLRDKDSKLIFNVHRNKNSYLFLHWLKQKIKKDPNHEWHYMSIPEARRLAWECGLEVEYVIGFGFLSSYITRMLPFKVALGIEQVLSRVKGLNQLGSEFIMICRPI